jgi:hypothetical protein
MGILEAEDVIKSHLKQSDVTIYRLSSNWIGMLGNKNFKIKTIDGVIKINPKNLVQIIFNFSIDCIF